MHTVQRQHACLENVIRVPKHTSLNISLRKGRRNSFLGTDSLFSEDQAMLQSCRVLMPLPLPCKNESLLISDRLNLIMLKSLYMNSLCTCICQAFQKRTGIRS